jgi:hypothetical protein
MSEKWIRDTGLVGALVLMFLGLRYGGGFFIASFVVMLFTLLAPKALYPVAYLWLTLTKVLAAIVPKIFFGLVFFVVIVPVGFVRKMMGKDKMIREGDDKSVFFVRDHAYTKADLETPF